MNSMFPVWTAIGRSWRLVRKLRRMEVWEFIIFHLIETTIICDFCSLALDGNNMIRSFVLSCRLVCCPCSRVKHFSGNIWATFGVRWMRFSKHNKNWERLIFSRWCSMGDTDKKTIGVTNRIILVNSDSFHVWPSVETKSIVIP